MHRVEHRFLMKATWFTLVCLTTTCLVPLCCGQCPVFTTIPSTVGMQPWPGFTFPACDPNAIRLQYFPWCICKAGFVGSGTVCTDLNECVLCPTYVCPANASCNNTVGSYKCICHVGFTGNGTHCADVNECTTGTNHCSANSTCFNLPGNYSCKCNEGFVGNGRVCKVDPCISTTCGLNASCKLVDGRGQILNSSQSVNPNSIYARCFCDPGLGGYPRTRCTIGIPNPCVGKKCAENATCVLLINQVPSQNTNSMLYGYGTNATLNATCQCDRSYIGNGDVYCTAACERRNPSSNVRFTFPTTLYPMSAYSVEICPFGGHPMATAQCDVTYYVDQMGQKVTYYDFVDVTKIPCNNQSVTMLISQVPVSQLNSTELQTVLVDLDVKTFNLTSLQYQDIAATTGFINDVAANATHVPVTQLSFMRLINIADHVTSFFDLRSTSRSAGFAEADLVMSLTTLAYRVTLPFGNSSLIVSTPTIAAEILDQVNPIQGLFYSPIVQTLQSPNFYVPLQPVSIAIPLEALVMAEQTVTAGQLRRKRAVAVGNITVRAVFLLHTNSTLFPAKEKADWIVSGCVGSLNTSVAVSNLANTVNITRNNVNETAGKTQNDSTLTAKYVNETCVFWNFTTQSWSSKGCCLEPNSNPPVCKCNHLTNFAVLMSVYPVPASIPQQIVSTVGCSISIVSLSLTIILLVISKDIRDRRPMRVLINICANLSAVYLIFLFGIDKVANVAGCIASATLLHYFLLVAWCWMAVYGHLLYKSIVKLFNVSWNNYLTKATLISYGFPLVVVLINLVTNRLFAIPSNESPVCGQAPPLSFAYTYLAENMCWIQGYSLYIAFLLPVACLVSFNIVMFVLVIRSLTCKRTKVASTSRNPSNLDNLAIAMAIASTLGMVWFFGFFMMISSDPTYLAVMSWLFTIVATLQGFCVFLLTCARQGDVRRLWWPSMRKFCCAKKDQNYIIASSTNNHSAGTAKGNHSATSTTVFTTKTTALEPEGESIIVQK